MLQCSILLHCVYFIRVLTTSHLQVTLKVLKFKIRFLKISTLSSCMSLFDIFIAQHISAYLAIIRCVKRLYI
jgi:hypothetical protein